MPTPYSLEIISDDRPSGFVEYRIKTPSPQNDISGKSGDTPEVFQAKMKKTLNRLNYTTPSIWARVNGRKAIVASLQARRLAKH